MQQSILRCQNCGLRVTGPLSDSDRRTLRGLGYLSRYCRECRGNTRWLLHESPGAARLTEAPAEEEVRARILLIDDDEAILTILGKALSREQFDLEMATSGRDAVTRLARGDYDIILSDIRMPNFDGKQLFEFLDEHLPEAKERVIFLTGDIGNPETLAFLEEAKRPYLPKPIDIPALLELVRPYLPHPQEKKPEG
jgi:CheY-like chemotaxis protein